MGERQMASISMPFESCIGLERKDLILSPPWKAAIHFCWVWNLLACLIHSFSIVGVIISTLSYHMLSFLIFSYGLIPLFHMITPIRHMEVTDHVFIPLYPYAILEYSLDLPLSMISHNLLISIDSYVLSFHSPISTPYLYNQGCCNFHCDAACSPHSLHIHLYASFHSYITLSFYAL